ncbi:MAG: hypothetical protein JWR19_4518 [Pedosphaera sp.]|nr:hypothetical protein [Pedosphaera sp.]
MLLDARGLSVAFIKKHRERINTMDSKSKTEAMRETAEDTMDNLRETGEEIQNRMGEFWETSKEKATQYARVTDQAIREKPYQAIGIALGIGLLTGLLINRSRSYNGED